MRAGRTTVVVVALLFLCSAVAAGTEPLSLIEILNRVAAEERSTAADVAAKFDASFPVGKQHVMFVAGGRADRLEALITLEAQVRAAGAVTSFASAGYTTPALPESAHVLVGGGHSLYTMRATSFGLEDALARELAADAALADDEIVAMAHNQHAALRATLRALRNKPALMVVDSRAFGALAAADEAGIPVVINHVGLLSGLGETSTEHDDWSLPAWGALSELTPLRALMQPIVRIAARINGFVLARRLNAVRQAAGLRDLWALDGWTSGRVTLVDTAWGLEWPRAIAPHVTLVGALTPSSAGGREGGERSRCPLAFMPGASDAFAKAATGGQACGEPVKTLADFLAHLRSKQLPSVVVSTCDLIVVQEALLAGVPLVCTPVTSIQTDVARRVEAAGVGVSSDLGVKAFGPLGEKCADPALIHALIDEARGKASRAAAVGARLVGGPARAAAVVQDVLSGNSAFVMPVHDRATWYRIAFPQYAFMVGFSLFLLFLPKIGAGIVHFFCLVEWVCGRKRAAD